MNGDNALKYMQCVILGILGLVFTQMGLSCPSMIERVFWLISIVSSVFGFMRIEMKLRDRKKNDEKDKEN